MGFFKKIYSAKIDIKSEPSRVFGLLRDHEGYQDWNPFTPKVDLDWEIGGEVNMDVHLLPGKRPTQQTEYLRMLDSDLMIISWGMKWGFLLNALRTQQVYPNGNHCSYQTEDVIRGPLTPIVHLIYGKHIQRGFERVCEGLKEAAESNK
jgi:uncharacterized protein YndB with AHSA1/START domain